MERRLTWYIRGWIAFVILVDVVGIGGIVSLAPTVGEGVADVAALLRPPNILPYLLEAVLIAPGIVALRWRARLRRAGPPRRPYASD